MTQSGLRSRLVRGLSVYLALAFLPTPIVIAWFTSRPSLASAMMDDEAGVTSEPSDDLAGSQRGSLTDLAPPQPLLLPNPAEEPSARLASLGLTPSPLPVRTAAEQKFAASFSSKEEARDAQLFRFTFQTGDRGRAEELMANLDRVIPIPPTLFAPDSDPAVPDPFVPLPARADYKRTGKLTR